tara:strand:- start:347 stop:496 length:150 start_codon:yes stop_codon:yes gene_type:complete
MCHFSVKKKDSKKEIKLKDLVTVLCTSRCVGFPETRQVQDPAGLSAIFF